jgi:hypothetical protein
LQLDQFSKVERPRIQLTNRLRWSYRRGPHQEETSEISVHGRRTKTTYLKYRCSNCQQTYKIFSLHLVPDGGGSNSGRCYKFEEHPPYGPPTPARLIRLFGEERETFLKGRRCENQGLGIGAFVYYRRVVENQKKQILDEIMRVSQKVGAPAEMIAALHQAKTRFNLKKHSRP